MIDLLIVLQWGGGGTRVPRLSMRGFLRSTPRWLQITAVVISVVAGLITIGGFMSNMCGIMDTGNESLSGGPRATYPPPPPVEPALVPNALPFLVDPRPTATPTPMPPLGEQLERALSIGGTTARGEGLASVAVQAILLGDYWTAITAAAATPIASEQASTLELVMECAIEDGLYSMATEAASRTSSSYSRGRLMVMALKARESAIKDQVSAGSVPRERPARNSMSCLEADRR